MKIEEEISQEGLNNEMKKREREEYYEDKLLELKMQKFIDNYLIEHELSKYKNKLTELNSEKESLLKEKEDLSHKIKEIEEEKTNYEKKIQELDSKITEAKNNKKELESNISKEQEYLKNMGKEDNLVHYIIKNFSDEFKKKIYEICSKKVNEALKNNNSDNSRNNTNDEKNNGNKNDPNFTMVTGQRGQYIPFPQNMPITPTPMPNMGNMKPMMLNAYNNNKFMMYPMYMPMPPNMQYQNPYFFMPMPMGKNMQQNKETHNDNNKNK